VKKILLKLTAILEIVCGLFGLALVTGGMTGKLPYDVVPVLWFGVFPFVSFLAGLLLLLNRRYAVTLSILVQLLQVPFLYTDSLWLNLGLPLNLTVKAVWNAVGGGNPTLLGVNFLALGVLVVLLSCRPAVADLPPVNDQVGQLSLIGKDK
jgi:hypothetical protein